MKIMQVYLLHVLALVLSQDLYAQSWTSIFDGKSLNGWRKLHSSASEYTVSHGELVGTTNDQSVTTHLATAKEYDDFILELEVNISEGLNSGIDLRSKLLPDGKVVGYQIDVDGWPRKWSGGLYEENGRGWVGIPEINTKAKEALKTGEWNKYRIEAIGSVIRVWINSIPIATYVDDVHKKGFISIQIHHGMKPEDIGKTIRWRNMRIQTANLKPMPVDVNTPVINLTDHISEAESKQGFVSLQNNSDFAGWRSVHSTRPPDQRWTNQNGIFKIDKSNGSETGNDIVTTRQYDAFELVFDFKLSEGANSGVKYFVDEQYDSGGKSGIGLEFQVLDDALHPDAKEGVVGNRTLASLYDLIPSTKPAAQFQKKIGEWNRGRIVALPNQWVQHWLNGFKVVEYERNSNIFKALVARSKYAGYGGFGSAPQGYILLQDHGDAVEFKNIRIRELK
jgi:hypothetical protein